ncbi:MAG: SDR family oxidoreductase [Desulfamplus sp.]|nr:SDR family oxidoreductase [Desulfamplus sp.]MBF0411821.1 SDR family oxidoreductase [Desulfamplus sp.]
MKTTYSPEEIDKCIAMLEDMAEQSQIIANIPESQRIALLSAAGRVSRPDRKYLKQRRKELNKIQRQPIVIKERLAIASTGIRSAREVDVFEAPAQITATSSTFEQTLNAPRNCYVCKAKYTLLHHFYDAMCPECAEFNYQKRFQSTSLDGQVALITGSRLKIGYQTALMMLRAGARVIATTRFPIDSALRYAKEKDFNEWKDRLHIYGLDLRHIPSVEIFAGYIEHHYHRLDILINNAAQTVRRPPGFYAHLMKNENLTFGELKEFYGDNGKAAVKLLQDYSICKQKLDSIVLQQDLHSNHNSEMMLNENYESLKNSLVPSHDGRPAIGIRESAKLSQIPYSVDDCDMKDDIFPRGKLDIDLQQVDLRTTNSWRLKLGEIHTSEMVEVQLVNAVAPFVLCNRLIDLMKKDYTGQKHIVNVTAMEGKFHRFKQASRHPHTNMAKAALNMMTHTAAADLAKYGIYINAVDTGWVTDEDPASLAKYKEEVHDFQPPLDIVDGAARVCDPFFHGILTGRHWCGKFLKDYKPIDW